MASLLTFTLFISLGYHAALGFTTSRDQGMDCSLGQSDNIVEKFIQTCPRPIIDNRDESYCCWSQNGEVSDLRCCTLPNFIFNTIAISLPLIILLLLLSFVVSIVCCLCCCCAKKATGGAFRPVPATGPYARPPSQPYRPVSDGRGFSRA